MPLNCFDYNSVDAAFKRARLTGYSLDYHPILASTNSFLLQHKGTLHKRLCWADQQTQGRGRSGKQWFSEPGQSILCSIAWALPVANASACSLVAGIAVAQTLRRFGVHATLKWPNDVLVDGRKIAGILVEAKACGNQLQAVIGIGLNWSATGSLETKIDQPWVSAYSLLESEFCGVTRAEFLAVLLKKLEARLDLLASQGFSVLRDEWQALHAYQDMDKRLRHNKIVYHAQLLGVDNQGRLCVEIAGQRRHFDSGEVQVLKT